MINTFHRVGTGPHPVIVLHGWFGGARSFAPIEPALDGNRFTYVFMDYRGYGDMQAAGGDYTFDEIANDTLALADALGFDTFSLIGHSMGGAASERVAMLAPERVRMLIPVAPVPSCGVVLDDSRRALFESAAKRVEIRQAIIDRSTGNRLPAIWTRSKAAYSWAHSSPHAFGAYMKAWSRGGFSESVKGAAYPVRVLIGEHDPVYDAALMNATYLAWYPDSTLEVLPNAGHYPMDEVPLALVASVERYLRERPQ
ncbi:alpha/beta hydrolase [Trinickia terrae]|uniref:Alpha/beta hydrolase n=1 Tax=Trinickia terrae TaxID=2571161 RepID=A0A4U1I3R7_9BURK|nr:alpha/beta hydrolase [Trinickia terrae]TKC87855.1 alpha/beta hydrolase [Trinickia terrae]